MRTDLLGLSIFDLSVSLAIPGIIIIIIIIYIYIYIFFFFALDSFLP